MVEFVVKLLVSDCFQSQQLIGVIDLRKNASERAEELKNVDSY